MGSLSKYEHTVCVYVYMGHDFKLKRLCPVMTERYAYGALLRHKPVRFYDCFNEIFFFY